jgi:acetyl-CoA carboxylase biotin carboxyl carrier protein
MESNQLEELRELIGFLKSNGIAEFEMERADLKVRLKFVGAAGVFAVTAGATSLAPVQPIAVAGDAEAADAGALAASNEKLHEVKSPIVGTFYDSPSPGAPTFVKIGDLVEIGQVLCIVEAMKLMNEIESDVAGEVVQRIASTGQPVEYGQPLFAIRPR